VINIVVDKETGEEKEVKKMVPKKVQKEVEFTYTKLLDNLGQDESLLDLIETMLAKKDAYSLIIGEDIITHPNAKNLAYLCGLIEKYTKFEVVVIPTQTNTLGVSLICDLDEAVSGKTVGYNVEADFVLSSLGDGDLDMPALNQQEGTFTNIDKRVVPTNAALPYNGYELNELAIELGVESEETIDHTFDLPTLKGYKSIEFDSLPNEFKNDRSEHRGYLLDEIEVQIGEEKVVEILNQEVTSTIIYRANPINQVNEFTQKAHQLNEETGLYLSEGGAESYEVEEGDIVSVSANNCNIKLKVIIDNQITGNIGYIPTFDKKIETKRLFGSYRFNQATISKV
jgi:NADH-quinone oxidoreductase subunit G